MFGWWKQRNITRARIVADAEAMIAEHGDSAYWEARDRALEGRLYKVVDADRTPEHWDQVRFEIRRRTGLRKTDAATKYLGDDR